MTAKKMFTSTSDVYLNPDDKAVVEEIREVVAERTELDSFDFNWFELATLYIGLDIYHPRVTAFFKNGLERVEMFTERETRFIHELMVTDEGDEWIEDIVLSRVPLNENVYAQILAGQFQALDYMLAIVEHRSADLTPELFYGYVDWLSVGEDYPKIRLNNLPDGVTAVDLANHFTDPTSDFCRFATVLVEVIEADVGPGLGDHFVQTTESWKHTIQAAVSEVRDLLKVGEDVPDEWIIQGGFERPDMLSRVFEATKVYGEYVRGRRK